MIVTSTKFVNLPDQTYKGIWANWVMTIPFVENNEDLEIPVSHNSTEPQYVLVHVRNNSFSFEAK